jgi:hypothetical protein
VIVKDRIIIMEYQGKSWNDNVLFNQLIF